jgi:hypothetical protein
VTLYKDIGRCSFFSVDGAVRIDRFPVGWIMNRRLIGLWLAVMVCSAAALSEESLNDLKRLPQFQRYIQRLKKTHQTLHEQLESPAEGSGASYAAGLSTSPSSSSSAALPTWDLVAALQEEQLASSSLMKVDK